ncbi:hypothetical protein D3C75_1179530 [compost metagenome]
MVGNDVLILLRIYGVLGRPNIGHSGLQRHFFLNDIPGLHPVIPVFPYIKPVELLHIRILGENQAEIHHLLDS